jgi:uncharacterized GH25 family protein
MKSLKSSQIIIFTLFLSLISILSLGHEFWLEPQKFFLKIGEKLNLSVFVGENFKGETVDFSKFEVSKFTHYSAGNEKNTNGKLTEKDLNELLKFDAEGNHLIAFNNTNKFIELDAKKFNAYLKSDGMDNIAELRKNQGKTNEKGREFYQRCAKTLIQVGNVQDDTYKINAGMRLELIPQQNPYSLKNGNSLVFNVLFNNQPLQNALVVVWQKGIGTKTIVQKFRSDANGNITFKLNRKGKIMVSAVRMVPIESPEADYQSYWGSYTFGF